MGCYPVKVKATYIRGELNFQSDAHIYIYIYINGYNTREKLIKIIWRKTNIRLRGFRTVYNSQYWSIFRMQCKMQKGFIIILSF